MPELFTEVQIDPIDQNVDYLQELVGDDKKFKTAADLAKGKAESDRYIKSLTDKLDELRDELKTRKTMEDVLTQINSTRPSELNPPQVAPQVNAQDTNLPDADLETRLEQYLAARESKRSKETNMASIENVLTQQFGDQANLVINNKARELGMSVADLKNVALQSSSAFLTLLGVSSEAPVRDRTVQPRSSVNSTGQPSYSTVRNAAYYENLKRTNPTLYFDGKTTVQQIRDAETLGDKYYA